MMFGYATNETENYIPLALDLSHSILRLNFNIRKREGNEIAYLRPDAKSQVTIEYSDDHKPQRIDAIVVLLSTMILQKMKKCLKLKRYCRNSYSQIYLLKNQKFRHYLMTKLNIISILQVNSLLAGTHGDTD